MMSETQTELAEQLRDLSCGLEDEVELERRRVPNWPDFTADHEAWQRAKAELPHGTVSEIAERAQQIKDRLQKETQ